MNVKYYIRHKMIDSVAAEKLANAGCRIDVCAETRGTFTFYAVCRETADTQTGDKVYAVYAEQPEFHRFRLTKTWREVVQAIEENSRLTARVEGVVQGQSMRSA